MTASVPKVLTGMDDGAKLLAVLAANYGIRQRSHANVNPNIILMEHYVYFALMDRNGMIKTNHVNVRWGIVGMETIVRGSFSAQGIEFITSNISSAYADKDSFGTDFVVWFNHNAAVERYGTKLR